MATKAKKKTTRGKSTTKADPVPQESGEISFLDIVTRFRRFLWDALGVLLIALALMTLLSILGLTQGSLLSLWSQNLRLTFGWGSLLIVGVLGYAGYLLLIPRRQNVTDFDWPRIISLEVAAFAFLILLAVIGGQSIDRAEAGLDGGLVGWGLAEFLTQLLGPIWWVVLILVLFFGALAVGLGITTRLRTATEARLEAIASPETSETVVSSGVTVSETPKSEVAKRTVKKKETRKPERLPPEYRKNFRVERNQETKVEAPPRDDRLPAIDLLINEKGTRPDERTINQSAGMIEKTLAEFGLPVKVIGFQVGPTVTQFAVEPGFVDKGGGEDQEAKQKVRVSQISSLARDLSLALSAERLRVQAPVPGRPYVGIEIPNPRSSIVRMRPIMESEEFIKSNSPLTVALGRNVSGEPVVADLASMPHLLIAGATGSGKSICISALTTCLAMNNTPEDLRLVMVDPKMVEMVRFNGLPHIIGKVETELERMLAVLRWTVAEMDRRYKLLEKARVRDIDAYNKKMRKIDDGEVMPRLVVLIDELADLMMLSSEQTEQALVRLAQMGRATGIHLVLATQRPSTDVVTGLIKANFPARISFAVASSVDSRVILDVQGAESLLGKGDMLYLPPEAGGPVRVQGVLLSEKEVDQVIDYWQTTWESIEEDEEVPWANITFDDGGDDDGLIEDAIEIVQKTGRASASMLQRRLRVGYPRAARLIDQLEELGVVGPSQGPGKERDVLVGEDDQEPV